MSQAGPKNHLRQLRSVGAPGPESRPSISLVAAASADKAALARGRPYHQLDLPKDPMAHDRTSGKRLLLFRLVPGSP